MRGLILGGVLGGILAYFLKSRKGSDSGSQYTAPASRGNNPFGGGAPSFGAGGGSSGSSGQFASASRAASSAGTSSTREHDNTDPDDNTLRDRIESEVFRDPRYSREHLNLMVANGVVDLNGTLPTQEEIDELATRIGGMRNVKGVQNNLHLPGTPSPNKEESLDASS